MREEPHGLTWTMEILIPVKEAKSKPKVKNPYILFRFSKEASTFIEMSVNIHKLQIIRSQEHVLGTTILHMHFSHIPSQFATVQTSIFWPIRNDNSHLIS